MAFFCTDIRQRLFTHCLYFISKWGTTKIPLLLYNFTCVCFFSFFLFDAHPQSIFWRKRCYSDISIQFKIQKEQKKFLLFLLFFFLYFILFFEQNKQISPNENLFFCSCLGKESFLFNVFGVLDVAGCCVRLMRLRVSPLKFCLSRVFLTILRVGLRENVSSMGTSGARKIHQLQHKVSLNCHFSITHQKNTQMNVEIFPLSLFFLFLFFFFFAH